MIVRSLLALLLLWTGQILCSTADAPNPTYSPIAELAKGRGMANVMWLVTAPATDELIAGKWEEIDGCLSEDGVSCWKDQSDDSSSGTNKNETVDSSLAVRAKIFHNNDDRMMFLSIYPWKKAGEKYLIITAGTLLNAKTEVLNISAISLVTGKADTLSFETLGLTINVLVSCAEGYRGHSCERAIPSNHVKSVQEAARIPWVHMKLTVLGDSNWMKTDSMGATKLCYSDDGINCWQRPKTRPSCPIDYEENKDVWSKFYAHEATNGCFTLQTNTNLTSFVQPMSACFVRNYNATFNDRIPWTRGGEKYLLAWEMRAYVTKTHGVEHVQWYHVNRSERHVASISDLSLDEGKTSTTVYLPTLKNLGIVVSIRCQHGFQGDECTRGCDRLCSVAPTVEYKFSTTDGFTWYLDDKIDVYLSRDGISANYDVLTVEESQLKRGPITQRRSFPNYWKEEMGERMYLVTRIRMTNWFAKYLPDIVTTQYESKEITHMSPRFKNRDAMEGFGLKVAIEFICDDGFSTEECEKAGGPPF